MPVGTVFIAEMMTVLTARRAVTRHLAPTNVGLRASLMGASKEGENKFNSEVECLSEVSDVERSDAEYAEDPRTWGYRMEVSHNSDDSDWLPCDSEVAFKSRKPRAARGVDSQNQSCQTEKQKHSVKEKSREVLKSVCQEGD